MNLLTVCLLACLPFAVLSFISSVSPKKNWQVHSWVPSQATLCSLFHCCMWRALALDCLLPTLETSTARLQHTLPAYQSGVTTAALLAAMSAPHLSLLCIPAAEPAGKKRKADTDAAATPKKAKQADGSAANVDASAAQGSRTIFCKNLPWSATEDDLAGFFADCGTVVDVRLGEHFSSRHHMLFQACPGKL